MISSHDTQLSAEEREALAADLEDAGWFCPATDIRERVTPETVLSRLEGISIHDGEFTADAAGIIDAHITNAGAPAVGAPLP
jgi:hypothetical protein